jgi:hypothetical protein
MPETTDAQRQTWYEEDCANINFRADTYKMKLQQKFDEYDKRAQAEADKNIVRLQAWRDNKKAGIKREWDLRLKNVKPGQEAKIAQINERYDGLSDLVDLDYEEKFNAAAERQYKIDGVRRARFDKDVEANERWRQRELDSEKVQLERHTQRQRG